MGLTAAAAALPSPACASLCATQVLPCLLRRELCCPCSARSDINGWDFSGNNNGVFDGVGDDHGT